MPGKRSTALPPILLATKPGPRRSTPAAWPSNRDTAGGGREGVLAETALALDKAGDRRHALARLQVAEDEGPLPAHALGVAFHDGQGSPHVRGEVRLVDDQQIRTGNPGAALARD